MGKLLQKIVDFTKTAVTVTSTTEIAAITSDPIPIPNPTMRVKVLAWCKITMGSTQTGLIFQLYRGATISGTAVGDATVITTVGGNTVYAIVSFVEEVSGLDTVQYTASVKQSGGVTNGSVVASGIEVEAITG